MSHPSDDQLLKHTLDLLDERERQELRVHLAECDTCGVRLTEIELDVSRLSGLRLAPPSEYPSFIVHRSSFIASSWLRLAAVLVLGFVGGVMASRVWQPEPLIIQPMPRITSAQASASVLAVAPDDALRDFLMPK